MPFPEEPEDWRKFESYLDTIAGDGPQTTLFALLEKDGVALPSPDEVAENDQSRVLWDVIHGLAQGAYLTSTDHLSDRELYEKLWKTTLRAEHPLLPEDFPLITHIDLLGGWSSEDFQTWIRYYASDEERQKLARDEGVSLPEHVAPTYQRDRFLPKCGSGS